MIGRWLARWGALAPCLFLGALLVLAPGSAAAAGPISLLNQSPGPGTNVYTTTPVISANFSDTASSIDPSAVIITVDGINVSGSDGMLITATQFVYHVPSILSLQAGNATVDLQIVDRAANHAEFSWGFQVVPGGPPPSSPLAIFSAQKVLEEIGIGAAIVAAGGYGYVVYLRRKKGFTFRKYFRLHPLKSRYVVGYLPAGIAFVVLLAGLSLTVTTPGLPSNSSDYVFVTAGIVALTPVAVHAWREKQRIRNFERAFAQFLFELADALRGGLDPARAVVQLSKTHTDVLAQPLRVAAGRLQLGWPFEQVLRSMVETIPSSLIRRYAGLIGEASSSGGETATVVHRAAKDMDDFVKIEMERHNQLLMPVAVLYIAYGILIAVLFALISIAPSLGSINIAFIGGGGNVLNSGGPGTAPRLDPSSLREDFFHLGLIVSIGTGAIVGAFTEGKVRFGLLHSIGLLIGTTLVFAFLNF